MRLAAEPEDIVIGLTIDLPLLASLEDANLIPNLKARRMGQEAQEGRSGVSPAFHPPIDPGAAGDRHDAILEDIVWRIRPIPIYGQGVSVGDGSDSPGMGEILGIESAPRITEKPSAHRSVALDHDLVGLREDTFGRKLEFALGSAFLIADLAPEYLDSACRRQSHIGFSDHYRRCIKGPCSYIGWSDHGIVRIGYREDQIYAAGITIYAVGDRPDLEASRRLVSIPSDVSFTELMLDPVRTSDIDDEED
jgi:hypothetical protein